jgi:hypothetical protein
MYVILKNTNMENNEMAWVLVKKISAKENRKALFKLFGYSILLLIGSFCFMLLIFEIMVWFWESTLINQLAKVLQSWTK